MEESTENNDNESNESQDNIDSNEDINDNNKDNSTNEKNYLVFILATKNEITNDNIKAQVINEENEQQEEDKDMSEQIVEKEQIKLDQMEQQEPKNKKEIFYYKIKVPHNLEITGIETNLYIKMDDFQTSEEIKVKITNDSNITYCYNVKFPNTESISEIKQFEFLQKDDDGKELMDQTINYFVNKDKKDLLFFIVIFNAIYNQSETGTLLNFLKNYNEEQLECEIKDSKHFKDLTDNLILIYSELNSDGDSNEDNLHTLTLNMITRYSRDPQITLCKIFEKIEKDNDTQEYKSIPYLITKFLKFIYANIDKYEHLFSSKEVIEIIRIIDKKNLIDGEDTGLEKCLRLSNPRVENILEIITQCIVIFLKQHDNKENQDGESENQENDENIKNQETSSHNSENNNEEDAQSNDIDTEELEEVEETSNDPPNNDNNNIEEQKKNVKDNTKIHKKDKIQINIYFIQEESDNIESIYKQLSQFDDKFEQCFEFDSHEFWEEYKKIFKRECNFSQLYTLCQLAKNDNNDRIIPQEQIGKLEMDVINGIVTSIQVEESLKGKKMLLLLGKTKDLFKQNKDKVSLKLESIVKGIDLSEIKTEKDIEIFQKVDFYDCIFGDKNKEKYTTFVQKIYGKVKTLIQFKNVMLMFNHFNTFSSEKEIDNVFETFLKVLPECNKLKKENKLNEDLILDISEIILYLLRKKFNQEEGIEQAEKVFSKFSTESKIEILPFCLFTLVDEIYQENSTINISNIIFNIAFNENKDNFVMILNKSFDFLKNQQSLSDIDKKKQLISLEEFIKQLLVRFKDKTISRDPGLYTSTEESKLAFKIFECLNLKLNLFYLEEYKTLLKDDDYYKQTLAGLNDITSLFENVPKLEEMNKILNYKENFKYKIKCLGIMGEKEINNYIISIRNLQRKEEEKLKKQMLAEQERINRIKKYNENVSIIYNFLQSISNIIEILKIKKTDFTQEIIKLKDQIKILEETKIKDETNTSFLEIYNSAFSFLQSISMNINDEKDSNTKLLIELFKELDDKVTIFSEGSIIIQQLLENSEFINDLPFFTNFINSVQQESQKVFDVDIVRVFKELIQRESYDTIQKFITAASWLKKNKGITDYEKSTQDKTIIESLFSQETKSYIHVYKINTFKETIQCDIHLYDKNEKKETIQSYDDIIALRARILLEKNKKRYAIRILNTKQVTIDYNSRKINEIKLEEETKNESESNVKYISLEEIDLDFVEKNYIMESSNEINKKLFCEFIFKLSVLIDTANKLIVKGIQFACDYCFDIKEIAKCNIKYTNNSKPNDKKYITIDKIIDEYEKLLEERKKVEIEIFTKSKYYLLTFIYGSYLNAFSCFLKDKSREKFKKEVTALIAFITNNKYNKNAITSKVELKKSKTVPSDYDYILEYLANILEKSKLKLEQLLENPIKKKYDFELNDKRGIFLYKFEMIESPHKQAISFYYYCTNGNINAKHMLYCSETTQIEEINSFIYRAYITPSVSDNNFLYLILFPELLKFDVVLQVIQTLNNLNLENMSSCLVFMSNDLNSHLCSALKQNNDSNTSNNTTKNLSLITAEQIRTLDINEMPSIPSPFEVHVIKSHIAGFGKSTYIKEAIKKNSKITRSIYFPLGGEFTEKQLITRLSELKIEHDTTGIAFHLDIVNTRKENELNYFLFNFLIFGVYSYMGNYFFVPKDMVIYIELPFGFDDITEKFPILTLFKITEITKDNQVPIIIEDGKSNQQLVINYLQNINKVNSRNLTRSVVETNSKKILDLLCNNEMIKIKFYSYYTIQSFIDVLGNQLQYFTDNTYLTSEITCHIKTMLHGKIMKQSRENTLNEELLRGTPEEEKEDEEFFREEGRVDALKSRKVNRYIKKVTDLRRNIVNSLIQNTSFITKSVYDNLLIPNTETNNTNSTNQNKNTETEAINYLSSEGEKNQISFDIIKPPLMFFNEDNNSLSIISNEKENTIEYNRYLAIYNSNNWDDQSNIPLINYKNLNQREFLDQINRVLNLRFSKEEHFIKFEQIVGDYKFTADNYIKMIIIILKIRANNPIIMMGETGCGKTYLIKTLAEIMEWDVQKIENKEYDPKTRLSKMKIFDVHAGTTDEDLMNFLIKEKLLEEHQNEYDNDKNIWVFLDEINTCNSMGVIKEMFTNHSILGKKILKQVRFIAACNPYRKYSEDYQKKREKYEVGLKLKEFQTSKFVYTVKPLPHSLLYFVFNFGVIQESDEKEYIKSMISETIYQSFEKTEESEQETFLSQVKEAVHAAQSFIRKNNDPSSVSLREVRRFILFYKTFIKYLQDNKRSDSEIWTTLKASILSIYICYYCRIPHKEEQAKFRQEIARIMNLKCEKTFLIIAEEEEEYLFNKVKLPSDIAKTKSLLKNLFALFFCIITKVPIIICGKPGCSKSLSYDILFNSMRGIGSENDFFKKYPALLATSYQGSLISTSEGILEVFEKARNKSKNLDPNLYLQLIYFDEMGLAEISPNNPLKVLHSQLEFNNEEKQIAFVGISNWGLDAAKMNRGVYVTINEPDQEDLTELAKIISNTFKPCLYDTYQQIYANLSNAFYNLMQQKDSDKKFSSRDFYYLIKQVSHHLSKKEIINIEELTSIVIEAIERNFGPHVENGINLMKETYFNDGVKYLNEYPCENAIRQNLSSYNHSRYLMLITNSNTNQYIIKDLLKDQNYTIFIGSQFEQDRNNENYSINIVNKIRIELEKGNTLVLKQLECVYPSLYNLFNQSFVSFGSKKYINISVGSRRDLFTYVHNQFKCIILSDQDEYEKAETPLLSRFEKHKYSYQFFLSDTQIEMAKEIYSILTENLVEINNEYTNSLTDDEIKSLTEFIKSQLFYLDINEIYGLVYEKIKNQKSILNLDKLKDEICDIIIPTFSQDIIMYIDTVSNLTEDNKKFIVDKYKKDINYRYNLENFINHYYIKKQNEHFSSRSIVYTYSIITEDIYFSTKIQASISRKELYVSNIKCDEDIEKEARKFYSNLQPKKLNVLLVLMNSQELKHFNHISHSIDKYEQTKFTEGVPQNILICYIISLDRFKMINEPTKVNKIQYVSHLCKDYKGETYKQVFIDKLLNNKSSNVTDFIKKTNEELILNKPNPKIKKSNFKEIKELKDISLILKNNIEKIVQYKFPFIIAKGKSINSVHEVINEIISQDYGFILSEIKTVIANYMKNQPPLGITYFKECINPSRIIKASINTNNTLIDIFSQLREEEAIECFSKILFLMLKEGFICTFKESTALSENQKHNIQQHYFKDVLKLKNTNINENEQIVVNYDFLIPCSCYELKQLRETCDKKEFFIGYKKYQFTNNDRKLSCIDNVYHEMNNYPMLNYFIHIENQKNQNNSKDTFNLRNIVKCLIDDLYTLIKCESTSKQTDKEYFDLPFEIIKNAINYRIPIDNNKLMRHLAHVICFIEGFYKGIDFLFQIINLLPSSSKSKLKKDSLNFNDITNQQMTDHEFILYTLDKLIQHLLLENNLFKERHLSSIISNANVIFSFLKTDISLIKKKENQIQIVMNSLQYKINTIQNYLDIEPLIRNEKSELWTQMIQNLNINHSGNNSDIAFNNIKKEKDLIQSNLIKKDKLPLLISDLFCQKLIMHKGISNEILNCIINDNSLHIYYHKIVSLLFEKLKLNVPLKNAVDSMNDSKKSYLFFTFNNPSDEIKSVCKLLDESISKNESLKMKLFFYFDYLIVSKFTSNNKGDKLFIEVKAAINYLLKNNNCPYHNLQTLFCISTIKNFLNKNAISLRRNTDNKQEYVYKKMQEIFSMLNDDFKIVISYYTELQFENIGDNNSNSQKSCDENSYFGLENPIILNSYDDIQNYRQLLGKIQEEEQNNFENKETLTQYILHKVESSSNLKSFIDIIVNVAISKIYRQYIMDNYLSIASNVINQLNLNINDFYNAKTSSLLKLMFNSYKKESPLYLEITSFSKTDYEIYLYAFYCALICGTLNENSFYGSLFSNKMETMLTDNYIPGIDISLQLGEYKENEFFSFYNYVREPASKKQHKNNGYYLCGNCFSDYFCPPCGIPNTESICFYCQQVIGGKIIKSRHVLTKPADTRIFYDEQQRTKAIKEWKELETFKYKYYKDWEKELMQEMKKNDVKGLCKISENFFLNDIKNVRDMPQFVYRLLNFILYSCLMFGKHINFINQITLDKFVPYRMIDSKEKPMNIFDVLKYDWLTMKNYLRNQNKSITVLMNMIFSNISEILNECPSELDCNQRNSFENKVVTWLKGDMDDDDDEENEERMFEPNLINSFEYSYKNKKKELFKIKPQKEAERLNFLDEITNYSNKINKCSDLSLSYYFKSNLYPTFELLKKEFNQYREKENRFPLLNTYLNKQKQIKHLSYLPKINKIANFMLNKFNHQLQRQEALDLSIQEANNYINPLETYEKQDFDNFVNAFNEIIQEDIRYNCHSLKEKFSFNNGENEKIAYCLVDNGFLDGGIYLTAIYQYLTEIQNNIIYSSNKKQINKETISIQNADEDSIITLSFDQENSDGRFNSFDELIAFYSVPHYTNQKLSKITFDLDKIEEYLEHLLLTGKKHFTYDDLNFITFKYEAYANKKGDIIDKFASYFNATFLEKREKDEIDQYFKSPKNDNNVLSLYHWIPLLIFSIYQNKTSFHDDTLINEVMKKYPMKGIKTDDIIKFFSETEKILTIKNKKYKVKFKWHINKLIDIYETIESTNFEYLFKKLNESGFVYEKELQREQKNDILKWIKQCTENKYFKVITPKILVNAIKKYILRILNGSRIEEGFNPRLKLITQLHNKMFWNKDEYLHPYFDKEKREIENQLNINIECAVSFYKFLQNNIPSS